MIALFDVPPRVAIERSLGFGVEGLLMGVVHDDGTFSGLVCLEDGTMSNVGLASLTLSFRYEVEKDIWVDINVPEPDHLVELAVAGGARFVVTRNLRDVARMELKFPGLRVVSPEDFLKEMKP